MKYKGRAYIYTIGCQMNVYDSEKLGAILASIGFEKTGNPDNADIVVCNTCSIRHKAEEKAFSFLGRFAQVKRKKPHLILVMAGCVAQQEGKKAFDRVPFLDIVLGTRAFSRFAKLVDAVKSGSTRVIDIEDSDIIYESVPDQCPDKTNRVSRFVTIMQGCENFCTYCVVPYVRGRERSRKPENIIAEIRALAASGIKEVTLLGQNVNSYGKKENNISFPELLSMVNEVEGIQRIRFATSHPKDLSSELMDAIAGLDKVCNHLHLPVQSGSNSVLKKMNRGYTREKYIEKISGLREKCPDIALSTDIIVGFPYESPDDFEQTLELLHEIKFDSIFAFAYSNRSSAPASKFDGQIGEQEKKDRLNLLLEVQQGYTEEKNALMTGKTFPVLVEGKSSKKRECFENSEEKNLSQMTGRTESNKIVHFMSKSARTGDMVDIMIQEAYPHSLWGTQKGA